MLASINGEELITSIHIDNSLICYLLQQTVCTLIMLPCFSVQNSFMLRETLSQKFLARSLSLRKFALERF